MGLAQTMDTVSITIRSQTITSSQTIRNLGAMLDCNLTMSAHVDMICRSAWAYLRKVGLIRKYLDQTTTEKLAHAYVTGKLDFMNSLLVGLPSTQIDKLKRIQNAAARVVARIPKHEHISPVLKQLHWLPITQRIQYKIALLIFKCLNDLAPEYLASLITIKENTRQLRSSSKNLLVIPKTRTVSFGDRSFMFAAATLWNTLPEQTKTTDSLSTFKRELKTHLFRSVFT